MDTTEKPTIASDNLVEPQVNAKPPCSCHCHTNHNGLDGKDGRAMCKCLPNCIHCNRLTARVEDGFKRAEKVLTDCQACKPEPNKYIAVTPQNKCVACGKYLGAQAPKDVNFVVKTQQQKHAGGRPSKYNDEMLAKTKAYIDECLNGIKDLDGRLVKAPRMPFIEEIALKLDIDDDTVVEWAKNENLKEFSAAIKKIKVLQKLRLQQRTLGKGQPTGAIFLLKVNHGMVETEKRILAGEKEAEPIQFTVTDYKGSAQPKDIIVGDAVAE